MKLGANIVVRKMTMRFVAGVAILVLSCGTSHKATERSKALWADMPYVIDGDNKEWPVPYPFMDNKEKIQYAIANDRTTLYITIKTSDAICSRKLEKYGLILFIDSAGGKDQAMQLIAMPEHIIPGQDGPDMDDPGNSMLKPPAGMQGKPRPIPQGILPIPIAQLGLLGFRCSNGNYRAPKLARDAGIRVSAGANELNEMIWEVALPLKLLLKDSILYVDSGRYLSVGISMPALGAADMPVLNSPQATGGGKGNFAGRGAGSRPPGGGGRGMPDNSSGGMPDSDDGQDMATIQQKQQDDMDRLTKNVLIWRRISLGYN
jgi:hypothetical protein